MLSPKNADQLASSADPKVSMPPVPPPTMQDEAAAQAIIDALQASPAFGGGGFDMMSDFLTSPLESPLDDDMLTTPALGSGDMMDSPDIFTSPVIPGFGGAFDDLPSLFPDMQGYEPLEPKPRHPQFHPSSVNTSPNFDDMYKMPSPDTPSMDPSSLHTSPAGLNDRSSAARRKSHPTGTRKNVTPESLVPLDAPIQNRNYVTPSQTSRKELPVTFARKRARSAAFGEDDTLAPEDGGSSSVTQTEEEAIKAKRLQNTLAARRSRKRKLEYQRELEDSLEAERREKEMWKARALVLEALLRDKGHDVPRIDDA
ncbi:hypothetical protein EWM64_g9510 [Hericium alpestre]|uniref:BZIP domain-containing protein n=1 Tax=Hericium alpestre TaxID=135208 RepID=A0A4Y9ZIK5_9AGAM|nr:hypothetical protein EWM64_g9510 [Hericium alpestre]